MADFRQYYHYDLPVEEVDDIDDYERVVMLFEQLPPASRCRQLDSAANEWNTTDYLLWSIEYQMRCLQWGMVSKKDRQGQRPPQPLPTPEQRAHNFERARHAQEARSEIDKILHMTGD